MAKKQELRAIISADARKFLRAVGRVKKAAFTASKVIAAGAGAAAVFSVKEAMSFAKGMAEVNTIAGLTKGELAELGERTKNLSREFGVDATDAVKGLYQALSAGVKGDPIKFLETAAMAATAGVTTLETAVDGLTTVMNAYGDSAGSAMNVSDRLFMIVKEGKITFGELANNIGKLAPTAKSAGVSLAQLQAMVAAMVKVEKPERAMTALRAAMMFAAKNGTTLLAVLKRFKGANLKQITAAGIGEEPARAIAILSNNFRELQRQMGIARNSAGATQKAFGIMADTTWFKSQQLKAAFQIAGVSIGTDLLPMVQAAVVALNAFVSDKDKVAEVAAVFREVAEAVKMLLGWYLRMISAMREWTLKNWFGGNLASMIKGGAKTRKFLGSAVSKEQIARLRQLRMQRRSPLAADTGVKKMATLMQDQNKLLANRLPPAQEVMAPS